MQKRWSFIRLVVWTVSLLVTAGGASAQVLLPESFDGWRYSHLAEQADWTAAEFDATDWKQGAAPLGFGEAGVVTTTHDFQPDQPVPLTTYFRATFSAPEIDSKQQLWLKIRVDDGYVAYLNGKELHRWNVPEGKLKNDTVATQGLSAPIESLYQEFEVPSEALRLGANVIAVEVHQASGRSSDEFLDMRLYARRRLAPRTAHAEGKALELSRHFNSTHYLDSSTRIPDGFLDGGRGMQIDEFGNAVSGREIMRVDRALDTRLQQHLKFASSPKLQQLAPVERAREIAKYIDRAMTPEEGHDACVSRSMYLADRYGAREVLLGDSADLCGAGVCRHRSLLFKLMADEAGLACALVRGNYGEPSRAGGHAWNELVLTDGTKLIVDVMNPNADFQFFAVGDPSLRHYLTIALAQKYPPAESTGAADTSESQ